MPERPVSPRDCALALAIPLTREAFFADLDPASGKDFARANVGKNERPESAWKRYRSTVDAAAKATHVLRSAGGTALPGATLADLAEAFSRHAAVTLVAHWRFDPIAPADVLEPRCILSALESPETEVQRFIAQAVMRRRAAHTAAGEEREAVAGWLAEACRPYETALDEMKPPDVLASEEGGQRPPAVSRILLESAFPTWIRTGRVVELAGGLCSAADLVGTIPGDYDGVVDLSVCNSLVLAERIKRERPRCLVVANRRRARPDLRLIRYRFAIRELALGPGRFTDIVTGQSLDQMGRR